MTAHGRRWRTLAILATLAAAFGIWNQMRLLKAGQEAVEIAEWSQDIARACIVQMERVYEAPDPLVFRPGESDAPDLAD